MRQCLKIGMITSLLLLMNISLITASQAHVIYEVDWVSETAGHVSLKWSDPTIVTPIMIQSWSQSPEGEVLLRYTSGNTVPIGFNTRRIEAEGLGTPFSIVLSEATANPGDSAFSDMPDSKEGQKAIKMLYDLGVLNGYADGTIKPQQSVSRAEFSKMLYWATGMTPQVSTGFVDVPASHWAQEYIHTLAAKGIVQGKGEGRFDPNGTITIGELVTILNRTFTLYKHDMSYPHESNGHWSFDNFESLVKQGLIQSSDAYYYPYMPDQVATREDCAILLSRILSEYHDIVD